MISGNIVAVSCKAELESILCANDCTAPAPSLVQSRVMEWLREVMEQVANLVLCLVFSHNRGSIKAVNQMALTPISVCPSLCTCRCTTELRLDKSRYFLAYFCSTPKAECRPPNRKTKSSCKLILPIKRRCGPAGLRQIYGRKCKVA